MFVLTEIKNRGVADVFFIVCDGLKGLPGSAIMVFKHANVQACVIPRSGPPSGTPPASTGTSSPAT